MNKTIKAICNLAFVLVACLTGCSGSTNSKNSADTTIEQALKPMKVTAFNDVTSLVNVLSQNGMGELKAWGNPMDIGYGSLTEYYQFGSPKNEYGLPNNIAYYLEGNEAQANSLFINLNVNNPNEKKQALTFLSRLTDKTFQSLKLDVPEGLLKAIKKGEAFNATNSSFNTAFSLDESKIETWRLMIKSK